MQTSITLNAKLYGDSDIHMLNKLYNYCNRMKIDMQMMNVNEHVSIRFTGEEAQLQELQDHLEEVSG